MRSTLCHCTGKLAAKDGASAWGFTETDLLQAEGLGKLQQEFGTDQNDKVVTADEAQQIVTKRLLIGGAITAGALALSLVSAATLGPGTPPHPSSPCRSLFSISVDGFLMDPKLSWSTEGTMASSTAFPARVYSCACVYACASVVRLSCQ